MGILKKIEKKLESAVEGLFAKGFKSKVEPVELAKKMSLAMVNNKIVALKKVWAPNDFKVFLSSADEEQFVSYQKEIIHELQDFLVKEAIAADLTMGSRPKITFEQAENLAKGQFSIDVKLSEELEKEINITKDGATQIIPIEQIKPKLTRHFIQLDSSMFQYDLKPGKNLVGRSSTNDISIADPSLSRHHLEIFVDEKEIVLKDLGSTNGTKVNGEIIKSAILKDKDIIEAGSAKFTYRRSDD
jgi:hypothetical protein